jgi:outer membrane biosynthesis protein TonB
MRTFVSISIVAIVFSAASVFGMGRGDASKKKTEEAVKPQPVAPAEVKPAAPAQPKPAEVKPVEAPKPTSPAEAPKPVAPVEAPKPVTPVVAPKPAEAAKPAEPIKDTVISRVNGIEIRRLTLEKIVDQRVKMQLASF